MMSLSSWHGARWTRTMQSTSPCVRPGRRSPLPPSNPPGLRPSGGTHLAHRQLHRGRRGCRRRGHRTVLPWQLSRRRHVRHPLRHRRRPPTASPRAVAASPAAPALLPLQLHRQQLRLQRGRGVRADTGCRRRYRTGSGWTSVISSWIALSTMSCRAGQRHRAASPRQEQLACLGLHRGAHPKDPLRWVPACAVPHATWAQTWRRRPSTAPRRTLAAAPPAGGGTGRQLRRV
mmetsp:Transcript_145033/g.377349  ORF Transcript_145033/g.377349 Transcript_145033/m.377349 type:complete len:232 (-) Transcript_145033:320-1015(-)